MPVPSVMTDLSISATSNSPAGTDPIGTSLDDYLRTIQAIVRREQAQGASIASAGTTSIGANTDGNYLHITGTTTITSFGTVAAGIRRTLVFDGALTLTYNATSMILPGAANITTVANDVAEFVSEGSGNWRCLRYLKAVVSANLTTAFNDKRSTVALTATTSPIWTAGTGKIIDGTGTPTITDFPAAPQAGAQREIYPAAGAIITDGGNIIVQGSANETAATGDKWTITAITTTTFYVEISTRTGTPALASFATQAQNVAGTIEGRPVDPLGVREAFNAAGTAPVYACRAWVHFDGTGPTISGSGNVSSISDFGTGYYGVNFSTAMQDSAYAANITAAGSTPNIEGAYTANSGLPQMIKATGSVQFAWFHGTDSGERRDTVNNSVSIFR